MLSSQSTPHLLKGHISIRSSPMWKVTARVAHGIRTGAGVHAPRVAHGMRTGTGVATDAPGANYFCESVSADARLRFRSDVRIHRSEHRSNSPSWDKSRG